MNEILERMQKDFNDFIQKADELVAKYKKEDSYEMKQATELDIGKLCWFNDYEGEKFIDILEDYDTDNKGGSYFAQGSQTSWYCCRRLTPSEVSEITGYKVEEV